MKKEKKTVTFKTLIIRRIIFIVIFAIIASLVTTYFIFENNKKVPKQNKISASETTEKTRNHIGLIDYDNDKFDYNELKINEVAENYEGYDINYFQIDGLKNKEIQEQINRSLNYDLKTTITEAKENDKIKGYFESYNLFSSNFGNTLSISYRLSSNVYDENLEEITYEWTHNISENFDLRTGKRLQIQDLFTDDCLGSDIFNNIFYNELVKNYTQTEIDEDTWNMKITDYNDIEEEILKLIIEFNDGNDIPFYFDEQTITLPDTYSRIFFEDVLDFVAIYNNFTSTENMFDGKYEALKDVPILTKRFPYSYHQVIDEKENYYLDFTVSTLFSNSIDDKEIKDRLLKIASKKLDEDVEKIKNEIKDNSNFSIFNYGYSVQADYENEGLYLLYITKASLPISKTLYDNEYKQKIQDIFRKAPRIIGGDVYLDSNLFYQYTLSDEEQTIEDGGWTLDTEEIYMDELGNFYSSKEEALLTLTPWGTND